MSNCLVLSKDFYCRNFTIRMARYEMCDQCKYHSIFLVFSVIAKILVFTGKSDWK